MNKQELEELIDTLRRRGTDVSYIEAKKAENNLPKRLWESLSSFGNQASGGIVVLGVDETSGFQITGVQNVKKVQDDLSSLCDLMEPPLRPSVEVHDLEGKQVIVAVITEVPDDQKPCHHRESGLYSGSCIRVGDGNRQMTQYEVNSILENRGQPKHDIEVVPDVKLQDLDSNLISKFIDRVKLRRPKLERLDDLEILQSMGVIKSNENEITLAGLLCFSAYPQRWFPSLTITFVHYPGEYEDELGPNGERFLDDRRFDGPLPEALEDAYRVVVRTMKKRHLVDGLIRNEIPEYPTDAVREALVNAVAHRDLSNLAKGSQIQIQMFNNRLVIRNPGGLYGPVNEENIGQAGVQAARNQHLIQVLEELGPAENRGSGISTIFRAFRDARMSPPKFEDHRTYFRVTFRNAAMLDEKTLAWLNSYQDFDISENQRLALAFLYQEGEITNSQYCRLLGVESNQAREELKKLVELDLLTRSGSNRWTAYQLHDLGAKQEAPNPVNGESKVTGPKKAKTIKERQLRIEEFIAAKVQAAPGEISKGLSIARSTLTNDLKKMVEDNRIRKTSESNKDSKGKYELIRKNSN